MNDSFEQFTVVKSKHFFWANESAHDCCYFTTGWQRMAIHNTKVIWIFTSDQFLEHFGLLHKTTKCGRWSPLSCTVAHTHTHTHIIFFFKFYNNRNGQLLISNDSNLKNWWEPVVKGLYISSIYIPLLRIYTFHKLTIALWTAHSAISYDQQCCNHVANTHMHD